MASLAMKYADGVEIFGYGYAFRIMHCPEIDAVAACRRTRRSPLATRWVRRRAGRLIVARPALPS